MSNQRKALGSGLEKRVVTRAQARGLVAARQPGSGVYSAYPSDVAIQLPNGDAILVECKVRSTTPSFTQVLTWLGGVESQAEEHHYEAACLVYNHKGSNSPKVVLSLDAFLDLLAPREEEG